jgi:hypothetical protein
VSSRPVVGHVGEEVSRVSDPADDSLGVLNCAPVRFTASPKMCLKRGEESGLNSDVNYDFVLVDTQLVDKDMLKTMHKLQPNAKVCLQRPELITSSSILCEASTSLRL